MGSAEKLNSIEIVVKKVCGHIFRNLHCPFRIDIVKKSVTIVPWTFVNHIWKALAGAGSLHIVIGYFFKTTF